MIPQRDSSRLMVIQQRNMNHWQLLTAMQALSIYILIRLDEGETDHNNLDHLLLATVTVGLTPTALLLLSSNEII